jgi:O-antigen/teichoic acid export membrane protein
MSLTSSVRWVVVSQCARIASQLVSVTVLSRLLPQQAYGMLAMAMTVTNLAFLFRDLGTSTVIIQKKELTDDLVCAVHAINLVTGLVIMGMLLVLAMPVARAYHVPGLASMLAVLSLIFPVSALGLLSQAMIERDSGFRLLARIEAVSIGTGLAAGMSLALAGAGVWSLVIQMLVTTVA